MTYKRNNNFDITECRRDRVKMKGKIQKYFGGTISNIQQRIYFKFVENILFNTKNRLCIRK